MNAKILVCCHKKDIMATQAPYMPIHVGKELSNIELDIVGDNTGDNISFKNQSYCELTGMYWAWKNLKNVDVIGLCHYRRYFDFYNQCQAIMPYTTFNETDINNVELTIPIDYLNKTIKKGTIIVTRPINYKMTLHQDYCLHHISEDFKILDQIIRETGESKYIKAFYEVMYKSNNFFSCNMFIMSWNDFDCYCNWLFDILDKVESRTNITNYNSYQKRVYGFISERLFNVYIKANNIQTIKKPIIYFSSKTIKHSNLYLCYYTLKKIRNNLLVKLLNK